MAARHLLPGETTYIWQAGWQALTSSFLCHRPPLRQLRACTSVGLGGSPSQPEHDLCPKQTRPTCLRPALKDKDTDKDNTINVLLR